MSRPLKRGLSYWRKDVNWYADPKVKKIGRRVGAAGQAILDAVFCKIYREGHYISVDEDLIEDIADETFTTPELVERTIQTAIDVGFFDAGFYRNNAVLTGLSLQSEYFSATSRRQTADKNYRSNLPYLLLNGVSVNNNPINVDDNPVNADNNREYNLILSNSIYSSSYSSIVNREQEEEILIIFYLKNIKDYRAEFWKFKKFYDDRHWVTAEGEPVTDVAGLARAWAPKDAEKRFNEKAIALVSDINNELWTRGYPVQDRRNLLDVEAVWFEGTSVRIRCSENCHAFLEEHIADLRPVILRYGRTLCYDMKN